MNYITLDLLIWPPQKGFPHISDSTISLGKNRQHLQKIIGLCKPNHHGIPWDIFQDWWVRNLYFTMAHPTNRKLIHLTCKWKSPLYYIYMYIYIHYIYTVYTLLYIYIIIIVTIIIITVDWFSYIMFSQIHAFPLRRNRCEGVTAGSHQLMFSMRFMCWSDSTGLFCK
jgi:hypothetical protein